MPASHRTWPGEILLDIFTLAALWDPRTFDVDIMFDICKWGTRNKTLASCARVCKAWTPFAQLLLHREVSIEARCNPFYDIDEHESTHVDVLRLLHRTLCDHPLLANHLQTLQTGVGFSCEFNSRYGSLSELARMICLCPRLVHLDLMLGFETDSGLLSEESLASLSQLTNVQHLSIRGGVHDNNCICVSPSTVHAPLQVAYQLLAVWAPSIEVLNLHVWSDDNIHWTFGSLLRLTELRSCAIAGHEFIQPLLLHAPNLKHFLARSPFEWTVRNLPQGLCHLVVDYPLAQKDHDLSHLHHLEALTILGAGCDIEAAFAYLRTLPLSVKELTLPVHVIADAANLRHLVDLVRGLPALSRLVVLLEKAGYGVERTRPSTQASIQQHFKRVSVTVAVSDVYTKDHVRPKKKSRCLGINPTAQARGYYCQSAWHKVPRMRPVHS